MASSASPSTATFGNSSSEGSNGLMALPAVMDMVADSQDEPGSGGSALFSDISTPTRSWKQIDIRQESKKRESPPRRSSSSPATPRTSQKGVRSTSKGGRSKSPTSADFRAVIKEKNKMEVEIGEYQKTLDEMSAAMANLNQEDYGSTIRIQELERRCEIASKQSGHLVSHHQHHMAEAWRKFEGEAQQMRKVEMNAFQYGEKKDMESNIIMQQMRQAEGTIMEQKREIALMKSYILILIIVWIIRRSSSATSEVQLTSTRSLPIGQESTVIQWGRSTVVSPSITTTSRSSGLWNMPNNPLHLG